MKGNFTASTPMWVSLGNNVASAGNYELAYVLIGSPEAKGGPLRFRFQVRKRDGSAMPKPAGRGRVWEFDLSPGESEVVPVLKVGKRRLLITLIESDDSSGRVRVLTTIAARRLPLVLQYERDGAKAVESAMPDGGPVVDSKPQDGAPVAGGSPAADGEKCTVDDPVCPDCGQRHPKARPLTPASRKILRMGLGALMEKASRHPLEADRIASELGVVSTADLLPLVMRLTSEAAECVPPV